MENKQDVKTNISPLQKGSKKSKAKIVSCKKQQKCFVKRKSFKKICMLSILIVSIYLIFSSWFSMLNHLLTSLEHFIRTIFYFDIKEQILAFFTDSFEINFCRRDLRCLICGRGYVFSYFYSNKKSEDMI